MEVWAVVQDQWPQAAQILQGGLQRASAATVGATSEDVWSLAAKLAELSFLQCDWPAALAATSSVESDAAALHGVQDPSVPVTETQHSGATLQEFKSVHASIGAMAQAALVRFESVPGFACKPSIWHVWR